MTRLNLQGTYTIAGTATSGALSQRGIASPTFSQVGTPNAHVSLAADGSYTLDADLDTGSQAMRVRVAGGGFAIEGPVTVRGNGSGVERSLMGVNLTGSTTWRQFCFYNNLYHQAARFSQFTGSGAWSQSRGVLNATVGTDVFRAYLSDNGYGLPTGTYHVYNAGNANVALGSFGSPGSIMAYTTAAAATFTYSGGPIFLFVKGSLPSSGFAIVHEDNVAAYEAGEVFAADFIAYLQDLAPDYIRFMDWTTASSNRETDWVHRTLSTDQGFVSAYTATTVCSYELMIHLCELVGADPWICLPVRATSDYVASFANLMNSHMPSTMNLWIELGNEVWNSSAAYAECRLWMWLYSQTKVYATVNAGTGVFTSAGHGLVTDDVVRSFSTIENLEALVSFSGATYGIDNAQTDFYVERIDANSFKLRTASGGGGSYVTLPAAMLTGVFAKSAGVASGMIDTNYGNVSLRNWDIIDAVLGRSRVRHIIASQHADTGVTSRRVAPAGVLAATDYIATAPYFSGTFWHVAIDIASGQFTPKHWEVNTGRTLHVSVYAAGSTPTDKEVVAGTGAINHQSAATVAEGTAYNSLSAVTGLTNGTTYRVITLLVDADGTYWRNYADIVASATPSTTYIADTAANQALRDVIQAESSLLGAHSAVASGKPVILYEYALDPSIPLTGGGTAPAAVRAAYDTYMETAACADAIARVTKLYAAAGAYACSYFAAPGEVPFSLNNDFTDTTDPKYLWFTGLAGTQRKYSLMSQADVTATSIPNEPSYPTTAYTFATAGWTYTLLSNAYSANFDISGNTLRIVNGTGIDWATPTSRVLKIRASNGQLETFFDVTISTGYSWYEGNALFAWSSVNDTDATQVDPVVGSALPKTAGSDATVASGLWDMGGTSNYSSSTGLTTNYTAGTPLLVMTVLDPDNHTATFASVAKVGSSGFVSFETGSSVNSFSARLYNGSNYYVRTTAGNMPTGKHVHWGFWDGTSWRAGCDLTENSAAALAAGTPINIARTVSIGAGASNMKHGSVEVMSFAGMTISDVLGYVQKLMTHHSIP